MDIQTLNAWVHEGISEHERLEFKRDSYGANAGNELRKDVSAMANTSGGMIVIGIDEQDGCASGISPVIDEEADAHELRVSQILSSGFDPAIYGWSVKSISADEGHCLVIDVPRSLTGPHRVTAQGRNRFFKRAGTMVYEPSTSEIRSMMTTFEAAKAEFVRFRDDRITMHLTEQDELEIDRETPTMFVHIAPVFCADSIDLSHLSAVASETPRLAPPGTEGFRAGFNADGFYFIRTDTPPTGASQLWRSGRYEATKARMSPHDVTKYSHVLPARWVEEALEHWLPERLKALSQLGAGGPWFVALSFVRVRDKIVRAFDWQPQFLEDETGRPLRRDVMHLPICRIDHAEIQTNEALRPALDALWQAGGKPAWFAKRTAQ